LGDIRLWKSPLRRNFDKICSLSCFLHYARYQAFISGVKSTLPCYALWCWNSTDPYSVLPVDSLLYTAYKRYWEETASLRKDKLLSSYFLYLFLLCITPARILLHASYRSWYHFAILFNTQKNQFCPPQKLRLVPFRAGGLSPSPSRDIATSQTLPPS
jgi:hypothetical protein